ncbi:probable multidrug resistance-associated protein lethal(2)03659 [Agrilus planipennis]|uniref:Probable multidrug resistance-associated protein lethal(2)03659 n=1 Tax=Agrilus planipennis TaxID=224129 RepID=A0A7F5RM14_AGRPL|nr:probable multidrug resistance-associated protein lethal(2)03659 [Agrilus planipennis]
MISNKKYENPSPETRANPLSKLMFWWVIPFLKYGYKHDLEVTNLYNTTPGDYSDILGDQLEKNWEDELQRAKKKNKKPRLITALRKTFFKSFSLYGFILLIQVFVRVYQPICLAELIKYFDPVNGYSKDQGWILSSGVILLAFMNILIAHHAGIGCLRIGMRVRIACCSLIYRKLLRLNRVSASKTSAGQMVNLLSNDVSRFDMVLLYFHYIWLTPIQVVLGAYVMWRSVGIATFAGLLAITLEAIPLQGYLSKQLGVLRYKIAMKTDHRVKLMSEVTSGIQVIKMYAWEKPFEKLVQLARKLEIQDIRKASFIRAFSTSLTVFTERTILYLTVVTYALLGNYLTGDKVFSIAQLYNTIQLYMSIFLPLAMSTYAEARVSVDRIQEFLAQDENYEVTETAVKPVIYSEPGRIKLSNACASWYHDGIVNTLSNITLDIRPGTLVAVVGQVGAGKSSLLQLLMKELPLKCGKMDVQGTVSFASQEPWLFVSSVRNNILFGSEYNKRRYMEVVKVCSLLPDFDQFVSGDKTIVEEHGSSLSGGQRARVNLARAVYRQADIYLFDDPLSAVDAHVGKELFEGCIVNYLSNKTRILVTHQTQFLKKADLIVILNNGVIENIGRYDELSDKCKEYLKTETHSEEEKAHEGAFRTNRLLSITSHMTSNADDEDDPQETQELIEKGGISKKLYWKYISAGSNICMLLLLVFLTMSAQIFSNAGDFWLTHWTNTEETILADHVLQQKNHSSMIFTNGHNKTDENDSTISPILNDLDNFTNFSPNEPLESYFAIQQPHSRRLEYVYIYTGFIILSIVLLTIRAVVFNWVCMASSKALHNTMFNNVLQATMRFFNTNPSGRILNRFSKDMGAVDELLPIALLNAIQIFLVAAGIIMMVVIVQPWMTIPTLLLAIMFWLVKNVYLASAQDLKRLEGVTKAPVFSHACATLSGLSTIRSTKAQQMVSKEFDLLQDQHTAAFFLFTYCSEAFGFYLDLISLLFLAVLTYQFIIFETGSTLAGNVGLVISQSLILTGMLQHGVKQTAETASQMTSVERILQYYHLEKEGPFESLPTKKPPQDWPQMGRIVFKNLTLRYAPDEPPVLRNLSFEIQAGEKVGIVGRTGAGKSSLISALFRLAPTEGSMAIDGIETEDIGLHDLRTKISIIPQEPVLFSASVRYNLDPFNKSDDKALWKALEDVELKDAVKSLDQEITEGGTNFSVGQRQLVCLARAILRNNRVLVMDEATANVDHQTDSFIQATIRRNFKDCTVLTIAHRLNTIMDSDKVLVMDAGEAVEFAHPHELLQKPDGHLTGLVKKTGKVMEASLRAVAEESFKRKQELYIK